MPLFLFASQFRVSSFDLDINTNSDGGDDDDSMVGYVGVSESGAFLPSADGYSVMSVGSYESDTSGFSGGGHEDGTVGTSSQPTRLGWCIALLTNLVGSLQHVVARLSVYVVVALCLSSFRGV